VLLCCCASVLHPTDSTQFNENLVFDAEIEVILESLVDLLCLDEHSTLETLFTAYDCNLSRVDVSEHLIVELTRCCGAVVNDEGIATLEYFEVIHPNQRPVPPHLKELCAEAILGYLKTLFRTTTTTSTPGDSSHSMAASSSQQPLEMDQESRMEALGHVSPVFANTNANANSNLSHRTIKSRKRQFRKAAKLFNEDSSKGIDFLVKHELIRETAADVASFLRNGLVLGLDKACVGQYLGELGKAASPGKNRPSWERDWFHKEVLEQFCSLFRFENQPLIDGLRMFLASFRLPGESQQIDRIIQAFADTCGRKCDEAAKMKIFSEDAKRASDTAFLLAYSIIMLNTDRHNKVIREDKKMSKDAFVRNNTDYG
jgi:Sec7-like guanine-nucleotide exchange factor